MKILAVDDDVLILSLLKEMLESAGYDDVHTCDSAEQALKMIANSRKPFDCFLLDIQMPGIDGIQLCRRIRDTENHADTPILMLTSMSEKSYIDRAFSAGATDYLTKPLDATEIMARLGTAEMLNKERKSLAESAGVIDSLIEVLDRATQHDLEEAIDLGKKERLLRYPAFENYVYQIGRGAMFRSTVFAAKIRDVQHLHRILPPLEFKNFLRTVATVIIDRLACHDAYISYRGEGEFVGLIPSKGQHVFRDLDEEIVIAIEETEGKHAAKLPATASLIFAIGAPIRIATRGELSRAIWTSVERARSKADPIAHQASKRRIARGTSLMIARFRQDQDEVKEDLRAEFAQMLREQLNSEALEHKRHTRIGERKAPPSVFKKSRGSDGGNVSRALTRTYPPAGGERAGNPTGSHSGKPMGDVLPLEMDRSVEAAKKAQKADGRKKIHDYNSTQVERENFADSQHSEVVGFRNRSRADRVDPKLTGDGPKGDTSVMIDWTLEDDVAVSQTESVQKGNRPVEAELGNVASFQNRSNNARTALEAAVNQRRGKFVAKLAEYQSKLERVASVPAKDEHPDSEILEAMFIAHRIAGVGKTLGFAELGDAARRTEIAIAAYRQQRSSNELRKVSCSRTGHLANMIEATCSDFDTHNA